MTYKDNRPSKLFLSKEGYDKYASLYDDKLDFLNSFEKGMIGEIVGDVSGKKVLDVGCGTGRLIQKLVEKGAVVTGADISSEMLKIAQRKFGQVEFVEADIEHLPFENDSFDVVVASFVIVHLKDLRKAFDEVYRVLKPGGSFIVTNVNQKKAPKLKTATREEIVIISYYHIPEHVVSALKDALFNIQEEEFINENGIWINQIVKAVKV
jgi:ubiquinone/menaquinone biosynthesis C-methylase UbiE